MLEYPPIQFRRRVACGISIGILIGVFTWYGATVSHIGAGDFRFATGEASLMLHGHDPYRGGFGFDCVPYPLTAALFGLPFYGLRPELAGAVFIGLSSGLLAFAVTKAGWKHLLVFASYPFWTAVTQIQWSPLLMAAALLPWLFPVVIAKPNIGIAVATRSINRKGAIASVLLILVTLLLEPRWPIVWWRLMMGYQSFIPMIGMGVLLLIALPWAKRDPDSRLLLLMGAIPQRWYYDALLLWLIPASTAELATTAAISWGAMLATPESRSIRQVAMISTAFNYLPMLGILLIRRSQGLPLRLRSKSAAIG